ncbi:hypothetical protein AKJ55_00060 [candidate division MSBL1 archaeon SCGC-AAA382M17]|uniref:Uncharacterized protein n=1 Tax=candidate division MSBL1 archaeon SCGC-AAA382M17 TaxID=1698284 RepID=A0ABR5TK46_9EURY|nr:hypothetical protein AKJ55_00060 [candidate division MSBL1 archaeon SCGC-AAA382M17]
MVGKMAEKPSEMKEGTILLIIRAQEACKDINQEVKDRFSISIKSSEIKGGILLQHISQLHTKPQPIDTIDYLKNSFLKVLRKKGAELDHSDVEELLNPILKDFLSDVFKIAEVTEIDLPDSYTELYEKL